MGKVVARFNLHMFSVVIVTGGKDAVESVELLYTNGTHRCSLPDLPQGRYYPTQVGLVTCGSTDDAQTQIKSCVTFSDGSWKKSHTLAGGGRAGTVGWASPQGGSITVTLIITTILSTIIILFSPPSSQPSSFILQTSSLPKDPLTSTTSPLRGSATSSYL